MAEMESDTQPVCHSFFLVEAASKNLSVIGRQRRCGMTTYGGRRCVEPVSCQSANLSQRCRRP